MSTSMFLELKDAKKDNLKGDSSDEVHVDTIEITSWGHSFEQPAAQFRSSTGSTIEKCKHELLTCSKGIDKSTPGILAAIWSGRQLDTATIYCYRDGIENIPIMYLKIEMSEVLISTYSIGGGEGDLPVEELGLGYGKICYYYTGMDKVTGGVDSGCENVPAAWDLNTNAPG